MSLIEVNGVNFSYRDDSHHRAPKSWVIENFSATIAVGEVLGICGPNGSGKSTLLRLLSGLLKPQAGTVTFGGKPLSAYHPKELAQQLAFVGSRLTLEMPYTVWQVAAMGRYPHLGNLAPLQSHDRQAIGRALEITGLQSLAQRPFQELSSGEQQRTLLARAIAQEAPLLMLDEPTVHLDWGHTASIFKTLLDYKNRRENSLPSPPRTMILVSHDLNLLAQLCTRLWMLKNGALIAADTPQALFTETTLEQVFNCQFKLVRDRNLSIPQVFLSI
jgi:iron complex transport system ATP-binding protein